MWDTELFHFLIELIWSAGGEAGYWAISSPHPPPKEGEISQGLFYCWVIGYWVIGYWLLVIGLLVIGLLGYWVIGLLVIGYWLLVIGYWVIGLLGPPTARLVIGLDGYRD
jgi:hypothetical protein